MPLDILDYHRGIIDQNADRQRESSQRHRVEGLIHRVQDEYAATTDSGIDARMINVSRQLPRNSRIINAVSPAAISPPMITLFKAALTKMD